MKKMTWSVYSIILILSLILPLLSNIVQASPDEEIRSPTSNSGTWTDPTYAYESNDTYAWTGIRSSVHEWGDYGFSIGSGYQIDEVLLGVEHYVSSGEYSIAVAVYDGTDWSSWSNNYTYETETMLWLNVTDTYLDWTAEKVNAIKTKVIYRVGGGGACYPNNMYFVTINDTSLLGKPLLDITNWEFHNPRQIAEHLDRNEILYVLSWNEEKEWFIDENSKIIRVDEHDEGNYTLYDMYSGELEITYLGEDDKNKTINWESHIELTSEHLVPYSLDGVDWILDTAESVYNHWDNSEIVYVNHLWWNYTLKPFPITNVTIKNFKDKVYNVVTKGDVGEVGGIPNQYKKGKTLTDREYDFLMHLKKQGVPIGQFPPFLLITAKVLWTAYVDWIPVKVTYSVIEPFEEVDCNWIGVNNTMGGKPTLFSSEWTDLYNANGLSHFLYSTNRTGEWENATEWSNAWRSNTWADYEAILNDTDYIEVFRFYVNDSIGTVYASSVCYFSVNDVYSWFGVTIIIGLLACFMFVIVLTTKK